jgi:N6-L-threonylcarbamoyladenine synthase
MHVLGIESTCDETACAVVVDGKKILSNAIHSQIDLHKEFGGVVPELACRRHIDAMPVVFHEALTRADVSLNQIDRIAVAKGPGLIGALLIGIHFAKALSWASKIPLVGVNHIEAHLYAAIMSQEMSQEKPAQFPALGMVLSGGHTSLVLIDGVGKYRLIGQTIDDAIGEAFDKTAKILGLAYPGGPVIEALAHKGNPKRFSFKAGVVKVNPWDFSFSGIKTAVLYAFRKIENPTQQDMADIAASFQEAVFQNILSKLEKAVIQFGCNRVYFGGGVTQNKTLRALLDRRFCCFWPQTELCLDNAAMIAGLGFYQDPNISIEPETKIPFTRISFA